jgi:tetratricopeptide (TPR) repeat protein
MYDQQQADVGVSGKHPTPIVRDAQALLRRGIEAIEEERFEEAVPLLRQAVSLDPQSQRAFLALGIALTRSLEIPAAVAALETAIELDPGDFYAHFRLGELYVRVGVPSQAREALGRALKCGPTLEQRRMARELLAIETRREAKRIWRPDFVRLRALKALARRKK